MVRASSWRCETLPMPAESATPTWLARAPSTSTRCMKGSSA
jgi:hypothetical protein